MIEVTDKAAVEIRNALNKAGKPEGLLRVGVKDGGCSGMSYTMDIIDSPAEKDKVFGEGHRRVAVDPQSLLYVNGMTLDFNDALIGGGFIFMNPNAAKKCSCGTSFGV
ncbi:MAG: iron-sulfur cluster assembly accessory protein [Candidatus Omnitrophica bacterium]|nr:iron-sulfur cluster assembly accessory protein [Candidatus Omnitrophota bacterium]